MSGENIKGRIAVFASGSGTNLQRLLDQSTAGTLGGGRIALVVSDKPDSQAITRAKQAGVPTFAFAPKEFTGKAAYEAVLVEQLRTAEIDWVVLAGYMRLLGPTLLKAFHGRVINLHPSLLPDFPGKDAIGQAVTAGVKYTGVTVHFVDEGMDTGPVIIQEKVEIQPDDTHETLATRIHVVEHRLLPQVVADLAAGRISLQERTVKYK